MDTKFPVVTSTSIIIMEWHARQGAWVFPRHSARRNDRPHADIMYGGQSEWIEIGFDLYP